MRAQQNTISKHIKSLSQDKQLENMRRSEGINDNFAKFRQILQRFNIS